MAAALTSLITVAPALAIFAGTVYNLCFYWTFQRSVFTLLTIEDHIASATMWLPVIILPTLLQIVAGMMPFNFPDLSKPADGESQDSFRKRRLIYAARLNWAFALGIVLGLVPSFAV